MIVTGCTTALPKEDGPDAPRIVDSNGMPNYGPK